MRAPDKGSSNTKADFAQPYSRKEGTPVKAVKDSDLIDASWSQVACSPKGRFKTISLFGAKVYYPVMRERAQLIKASVDNLSCIFILFQLLQLMLQMSAAPKRHWIHLLSMK